MEVRHEEVLYVGLFDLSHEKRQGRLSQSSAGSTIGISDGTNGQKAPNGLFTLFRRPIMIGIYPVTTKAQDWIRDNAEADPWQWINGVLWGEGRMMEVLINAMVMDDLSIDEDFDTYQA